MSTKHTTERERLLGEIERFLREHGVAPTTFGRGVMNDSAFVFRMRDGAEYKSGTADKVRKFMRDYRPEKTQRRRCNRSCAA